MGSPDHHEMMERHAASMQWRQDQQHAAEIVCHEEQLTVWAGEVVSRVAMGGHLRDGLSHEDTLNLHADISDEIRRIVEGAFLHPALDAARDVGAAGIPMLVRGADGWHVLGEDGQRFDLVPLSSRRPTECNRLAEDARSWRAVAEQLETEMQGLLAVCDSEISAQTSNSSHSDRYLAAYAEGALRVARDIAARIKQGAAAR